MLCPLLQQREEFTLEGIPNATYMKNDQWDPKHIDKIPELWVTDKHGVAPIVRPLQEQTLFILKHEGIYFFDENAVYRLLSQVGIPDETVDSIRAGVDQELKQYPFMTAEQKRIAAFEDRYQPHLVPDNDSSDSSSSSSTSESSVISETNDLLFKSPDDYLTSLSNTQQCFIYRHTRNLLLLWKNDNQEEIYGWCWFVETLLEMEYTMIEYKIVKFTLGRLTKTMALPSRELFCMTLRRKTYPRRNSRCEIQARLLQKTVRQLKTKLRFLEKKIHRQ